MKTTCPRCACTFDIREAAVLSACAFIIAKRRKRNGTKLTSEQAQAMQARSVEARRASRDAQATTPTD